jgi:hypothetical protein
VITLLFAAATGACSRQKKTEAPAIDLALAESTVHKFFDAARAGDCKTLLPMRTEAWTSEQCEEFVHHFKANRTELRAIAKVAPDGRRPAVALVTAKLEMRGKDEKEHTWLMPVECAAGTCRVGFW